ncbi:MarR family transcriptional regulator, partial [Streptomyces hundungensis]|uniref:MarR family transcriptional regulator n=1 Tax=Streptomyces hundungensis TaxID=1077946 RepID=UPI0033DBB5CD
MLLSRHQVLARRERDPERLDRSAYLLLCRIDTQGPMSIGQLADAFGLDTSTVNRQTAALLRCGLAERVMDPDGGMARKLRITDEGGRRLRADREREIPQPRMRNPCRVSHAYGLASSGFARHYS